MDTWPSQPRHKRSFGEMSRQAGLSSSPIEFREPFSNPAPSRFAPTPTNNTSAPSILDRHRTSRPPPYPHSHVLNHDHDHILNLQAFHRSEDMADRAQTRPRPRLEHRASQTIIDLTDEPDEIAPISRNRDNRRRSQHPPPPARSNRGAGVIDLTDDTGEPDMIITGGREISAPRAQGLQGNHPGSLFLHPLAAPVRNRSPSLFVQQDEDERGPVIRRLLENGMHAILGIGGHRRGDGQPATPHHELLHGRGLAVLEHFDQMVRMPQVMPHMNYQNHAFAQPKPSHVAPKPAREGFTRSPKEEDILICPSCEEELVHNKETKELVAKKVRSRKDMEEHPFWVVKECGHVYCNSCYQNRGSRGKVPKVTFSEIEIPGKKKLLACAVEDCQCDVRSKDKWVGVFL